MASTQRHPAQLWLASWSVCRSNVTWLRRSVHAQSNRERGLPVSLRQACNRTRSVIRWPALCLLDLSVPTVWPPTSTPPFPLICRSHLIIAPSLSQTLRCIVSTTSPTSPFHCWGGKAVQTHPPSNVSPSLNPTHHLLFVSLQTSSLNQHADSVTLVTHPLPDRLTSLLDYKGLFTTAFNINRKINVFCSVLNLTIRVRKTILLLTIFFVDYWKTQYSMNICLQECENTSQVSAALWKTSQASLSYSNLIRLCWPLHNKCPRREQ